MRCYIQILLTIIIKEFTVWNNLHTKWSTTYNPRSAKVFCSEDSSCSIKCTDCSMAEDQMKSKSSYVTIGTASESFINYYEYLERNIV